MIVVYPCNDVRTGLDPALRQNAKEGHRCEGDSKVRIWDPTRWSRQTWDAKWMKC